MSGERGEEESERGRLKKKGGVSKNKKKQNKKKRTKDHFKYMSKGVLSFLHHQANICSARESVTYYSSVKNKEMNIRETSLPSSS